jgi:hypothetical protein
LGGRGGGAYFSTLYNCTLTSNGTASEGGGACACTLFNCVLTGNSAIGPYSERGGYGGGAYFCALYNCTLTGNSAAEGGGGACESTLYNCIVYYNTAPNGANYFTGVTQWGEEVSTVLNVCCTTPLPTNGIGNITGPPRFIDMDAGDFRFQEDSPCIDAGTNLVGLPIVQDGWDENTGEPLFRAYTYDPTDIFGNTRFIDGNFDGKVAWDIGAYEFNSFKPPRLTSAPQLTADGWKLTITGATNKWVRFQRSSNLRDWEDVWFGDAVFMGPEGVQQYTDWEAGTHAKVMFYRAVVP